NARISELLENLGVLHLFKVTEGPVVTPDGACANDVQSTNASREQVTRTCLEAHQTLMDINPGNVTRFKDVTAFLADDLKKMKAGSTLVARASRPCGRAFKTIPQANVGRQGLMALIDLATTPTGFLAALATTDLRPSNARKAEEHILRVFDLAHGRCTMEF